jgi:autotransporter-associated beta strand protein
VNFFDTSTAGNAVIVSSAGVSGGACSSITPLRPVTPPSSTTSGGITAFAGGSTAGNATITANSGGLTAFTQRSTGGDARFITNAGGRFDISGLSSSGMTAGSIEGAGSYFLGSKVLTVGPNNLSTVVSGSIADGGLFGGTGGSLIKVGTGTLTLSGTNTYTGGTSLESGALVIGNDRALGTGALSMAAGTTLSFLSSGNFTVSNPIRITGDPSFTPPSGTVQTISGVISDGSSPGTVLMNGAGVAACGAFPVRAALSWFCVRIPVPACAFPRRPGR